MIYSAFICFSVILTIISFTTAQKCPKKCWAIRCTSPSEEDCLVRNEIFKPADHDCFCCSACIRKLNEGDFCGPRVKNGECAAGLTCDRGSNKCSRIKKCPGLCERVRCARSGPSKCLGDNGIFQPPDGDCNCCGSCKVVSRPNPTSKVTDFVPQKMPKYERDICNPTISECAIGLNCDRQSKRCVRSKKCPGLCASIKCARIDPTDCSARNGIIQPPNGDCTCCPTCKVVSRPRVIDHISFSELTKVPKNEGDICDPSVTDVECAIGLTCDSRSNICVPNKKCPGLCDTIRCARPDESKCTDGIFVQPDGDCNCCGDCMKISRPNPKMMAKNFQLPEKLKISTNCPKDVCTYVKCGVREGTCNTPDKFILPNGGICGCCSACVKKLYKGDPCKITIGDEKPDAVCFTGLTCHNTKRICV